MNILKYLVIALVLFGLGAATGIWFSSHHGGNYPYDRLHEQHGKREMKHGQDGHGMTHEHDEVNMPGLEGKDTSATEVNDLKKIFRDHAGITRKVENLPNGIKTITESDDQGLRDAIISHVSMMVTRLQEGRNPEVRIQSQTLDKLFDMYDEIETEIEMTDKGVAIIQTSSNPAVVKLLQTHAAEVSDMAARGMDAVHERMMDSKGFAQ